MGNVLIIDNADFSNVAVDTIEIDNYIDISILGEVTLHSKSADAIYYTLDGSEPTANSTLYDGAFTLEQVIGTTKVRAVAMIDGSAVELKSKSYTLETTNFTWDIGGIAAAWGNSTGTVNSCMSIIKSSGTNKVPKAETDISFVINKSKYNSYEPDKHLIYEIIGYRKNTIESTSGTDYEYVQGLEVYGITIEKGYYFQLMIATMVSGNHSVLADAPEALLKVTIS